MWTSTHALQDFYCWGKRTKGKDGEMRVLMMGKTIEKYLKKKKCINPNLMDLSCFVEE